MSGAMSRNKGKRGERSVELLLLDRDYEVIRNAGGSDGHDMLAIKDGVCFSVEVKNTKSLAFDMYLQCRKNAGKKRRILAWHPSGWGFGAGDWVMFLWNGDKAEVKLWTLGGSE